MAAVTALRTARRGRVAVELDGGRWRTLPAEVVVRCGLAVGVELDRARLRELRRELRRVEALERAARTLARHDLSARALDERLERGGVRAPERREVVGTLTRVGLVDDERFAASRAAALAERGAGDAMILDDLERRGVPPGAARAAVAGLEPERERAARITAGRGSGARTARYLAARGFSEEAVEEAIADGDGEAIG